MVKAITGQEKNLDSVVRHHVMSVQELYEVKMFEIYGQSAAKHLNLLRGMVKVQRLDGGGQEGLNIPMNA